MPVRNASLRGYLGELIVRQWLELKCRTDAAWKECRIVEQICHTHVSKKGGAYLDFGILNKCGEVVQLIEVKSEDYVAANPSKKINKAIYVFLDDIVERERTWEKVAPTEVEFFSLNENGTFPSAEGIQILLIVLTPPSDKFFDRLDALEEKTIPFGKENFLTFFELFQDLEGSGPFNDVTLRADIDDIILLLSGEASGKHTSRAKIEEFILSRDG